ncbi:non-hemolytic phospholipase C precursor [Aulographum hederae CBS 113979]|uniref:Non-hemolytic phospholipase C n=1 Tax=Aulographum hederae CBS 113979 TaxID=1176131 RepID=A0A6G1GQY6_9PEZI|nr:non-hemolytic phospholipase C precursor [Aulographum hederae CBS 113979]
MRKEHYIQPVTTVEKGGLLNRGPILVKVLIMLSLLSFALFSCYCVGEANAASLADIDHVVLFMQENRAFDHYFGTMAGIRGFADPNAQVNAGRSVFYQDVDKTLSTATDYLLPFYLNYQGGDWVDATQCMTAGSNGWAQNQGALNGDLNNHWALNNTPWSWGYYKRSDLPVHFSLAEGWTVGDMYQESVIASTNPNRVSWASGSINVAGGPQSTSQGGVYIDNNESPGCEGTNLNCYPLKWKTAAEYYQDAGVTWQLYQDTNNFDDNPLAWFENFQKASSTSDLGKRGMSFVGLDKFYADAAAGTLPQVSYIVGPAELSEHPPYQPKDGAWLQRKVAEAVINGKAYNKTALIISYDETGGFGDHVTPYHSPKDTPGEWMQDPYGKSGDVYSGPGFRLPFYIISPWTRGGNVYTEHADHSSQIMFVEKWLAAKGKTVTSTQIPSWRRSHMTDLTKAFDFSKPDYSLPTIPDIAAPSVDSKGKYNGASLCQSSHSSVRPTVPYGKQNPTTALATEQGFKPVRGQLTEGRYLTFEVNGYALAAPTSGSTVTATTTTSTHNSKAQRFVLHEVTPGGNQFTLTSAVTGAALSGLGTLAINDLGNGKGYSLQDVATGKSIYRRRSHDHIT